MSQVAQMSLAGKAFAVLCCKDLKGSGIAEYSVIILYMQAHIVAVQFKACMVCLRRLPPCM